MAYQSVVISSGHGKHIRGASDILDEVDEARRVVDEVAVLLRAKGVTVKTFHDNTSYDQSTNLATIVNYHNAQTRQLDISVHFNAYEHTSKPMGVECLYVTQEDLAAQVSRSIASCGFIDRGPKYRNDLYFLGNTEMPAILIETCFVDSVADANIYDENWDGICTAIADTIGGTGAIVPPEPPVTGALFQTTGKTSHFGGPDDTGVSPSEGLAFISEIGQAPHLFLPYQPANTTGLARRLNPQVHYLACRWDYNVTSKAMLRSGTRALVRNPKTGFAIKAFPGDWGPSEGTGRTSDLSPQLLEDLGLSTDDVVEVTYPAPGETVDA
jgi:hypothetical protein